VAYGASLENWFPPGTMGSNPIPCAIQHIPCVHESYIDFLTEVRENKMITAKNKQIIINALRKRVSSLWDSPEVKAYIKNCELSNGRKNLYGQAYRDWCNWKGFDYQPKHFKRIEKLPYIPTENEIDQLIGGLGISMESGLYAGQAIIDSLENGEATAESLWSYSCIIMQTYGKQLANLDVLRRCLNSIEDKYLDYGMKINLVSEDDLNRASEGNNVLSNIQRNIIRVVKGLRHPRLLNKLRHTTGLMRQVLTHYENYPTSPENFMKWRGKTINPIDQVRARLHS
jgi:hypothetical protein